MRTPLVVLAALAVAVAVAAPAGASTPIRITIAHATHGCHTWSIANGALYPAHTIRVHAGTALTVVNNDVMPHAIVQIGGPRVALTGLRMGHMGATTALTLTTPGIYRFVTKAGADYPGVHVKTIGADNVLHLMVIVG